MSDTIYAQDRSQTVSRKNAFDKPASDITGVAPDVAPQMDQSTTFQNEKGLQVEGNPTMACKAQTEISGTPISSDITGMAPDVTPQKYQSTTFQDEKCLQLEGNPTMACKAQTKISGTPMSSDIPHMSNRPTQMAQANDVADNGLSSASQQAAYDDDIYESVDGLSCPDLTPQAPPDDILYDDMSASPSPAHFTRQAAHDSDIYDDVENLGVSHPAESDVDNIYEEAATPTHSQQQGATAVTLYDYLAGECFCHY